MEEGRELPEDTRMTEERKKIEIKRVKVLIHV